MRGHFVPHSEETKKKMSERKKELMKGTEFRKEATNRIIEAGKKYRKVITAKQKIFWANQENRKKLGEKIKKSLNTPEQIERARKHMLELWKTPKFIEAHKEVRKKICGQKRTRECRERLSAQKLGNKNPMKRHEVRKLVSAAHKKLWGNQEYRNHQIAAHFAYAKKNQVGKTFADRFGEDRAIEICKKISKSHKGNLYWINAMRRPNKSEIQLQKILSSVGVKYRYNVKEFIVSLKGTHKVPDFYNEDKTRVIEFFGEFWHKDKNEEKELIQNFEDSGIKCLVIWGEELKSLINLKEKIMRFENDIC